MHPRKRAQYISTEHAWIGYTHSYLLTCAPVSFHTVRVSAHYRFHNGGLFRNRLNPCSHVHHFALAMFSYSHYVYSVWVRCIIYEYHTQRWLKIFKEPHTASVFISHKCTKHTPSRCILEMYRKRFSFGFLARCTVSTFSLSAIAFKNATPFLNYFKNIFKLIVIFMILNDFIFELFLEYFWISMYRRLFIYNLYVVIYKWVPLQHLYNKLYIYWKCRMAQLLQRVCNKYAIYINVEWHNYCKGYAINMPYI